MTSIRYTRLIITFFALILPFITGCSTSDDRNNAAATECDASGVFLGTTYGVFLGTWFDYYRRGECFYRVGKYDLAIENFEKAISKRPKDKWRTRTYGMHFVNYFPNRYIGETHYHQGSFDKATKSLKKSLKTADSARTSYFLDKALERGTRNSNQDKSPPVITLGTKSPGGIVYTNERLYELDVTVQDDTYVRSLSVNGNDILIDPGEKRIQKKLNVPLRLGMNKVSVSAVDIVDKIADGKSVNIYLDLDAPQLIIDTVDKVNRKIVVKGRVFDATEVDYLRLNNKNIPLIKMDLSSTHGQYKTFAHTLLNQELSENLLIVEAVDIFGNVLNSQSDLNKFTDKKASNLDRKTAMQLAFVGNLNDLLVNQFNQWMYNDVKPPEININVETSKNVYQNAVLLSATLSDDIKIDKIHIKDKKDNIIKTLDPKGSKEIHFSEAVPLDKGENIFTIVAIDFVGKSSDKEVKIFYEVPDIFKEDKRMSITWDKPEHNIEDVLKFTKRDNLDSYLLAAVVKIDRFQKINNNPDLGIKVEIDVKKEKNGLTIELKAYPMLNNSELLKDKTTTVYKTLEDDIDLETYKEKLNYYVYELITRLSQKFPIVTGEVMEVLDKDLVLNAGSQDDVSKAHKFYIICGEQMCKEKKDILAIASPQNIKEDKTTATIKKWLIKGMKVQKKYKVISN